MNRRPRLHSPSPQRWVRRVVPLAHTAAAGPAGVLLGRSAGAGPTGVSLGTSSGVGPQGIPIGGGSSSGPAGIPVAVAKKSGRARVAVIAAGVAVASVAVGAVVLAAGDDDPAEPVVADSTMVVEAPTTTAALIVETTTRPTVVATSAATTLPAATAVPAVVPTTETARTTTTTAAPAPADLVVACAVGSWLADNETIVSSFTRSIAASGVFELQAVTGSVRLDIEADGHVLATFEELDDLRPASFGRGHGRHHGERRGGAHDHVRRRRELFGDGDRDQLHDAGGGR